MDKKKKTEKNLGKLIVYCKSYMPIIVIALTSAVIATILSLLGPDKLSEMTDTITNGILTSIDMEKITSIGLILVIIYGASVILNLTQGYIMATVTQRITKNLRKDISKKINKHAIKILL